MSVGIGRVWLSYGEVNRMFELGVFLCVISGDECV